MNTLIVIAAAFGVMGQPDIHKVDAYGTNRHMDQYGNVVITEPGTRIEKPNAYGPGIHMDQYGKPVNTNYRPFGHN